MYHICTDFLSVYGTFVISLQALMSLFVLSCKDGWVNIMYDGLDAVGVDQQVILTAFYLLTI